MKKHTKHILAAAGISLLLFGTAHAENTVPATKPMEQAVQEHSQTVLPYLMKVRLTATALCALKRLSE